MRTLIAELARGKGIWRAMLYRAMRNSGLALQSPILDIGSGAQPGYWRIMGLRKDAVISMDSNAAVEPSVVRDASLPFPWNDGYFGTVFLMNCLYAFPDPSSVMKEACRVLRSGGTAAMSFPLVFPYTPEPGDYFRFTEDGIRMLCTKAGFHAPRVIPVGGRWTAVAYLAFPFQSLVTLPVFAVALFLDRALYCLWPALSPIPIGYFVIARKP